MKTFKVIYLVFDAALSLLMYWVVILYSYTSHRQVTVAVLTVNDSLQTGGGKGWGLKAKL